MPIPMTTNTNPKIVKADALVPRWKIYPTAFTKSIKNPTPAMIYPEIFFEGIFLIELIIF